MATAKPKYAGLPDLDESGDVFETPELTDDTSTVAPSAVPRTLSRTSSAGDGEDSEFIDRHRLDQESARARFLGSRVDAKETDFSDRIDGEKRSYLVKSRRRRKVKAEDDDGLDEEDSEDEDLTPEGLQKRLARLTREAAELKSEFQRRQAEGENIEARGLETLDQSLGDLNKAILQGQKPAQERLEQKLNSRSTLQPGTDAETEAATSTTQSEGYTLSYAPTYSSSHALAKATSFDARLALLEALLGADSTQVPGQDESAYRKPVLPTLDILDKQLATLSSTSAASLDGVQKRVQVLTRETERLEEARRAAKAARDELSSPRSSRIGERIGSSDGESSLEDPEQVSKINALHGTLPTIESLAPIVPGILDRLRSLRLLHADAANAGNSLGELEKRQAELDEEINEWRQSLSKVESMLADNENKTQENMKVVQKWVTDLAGRMKSLD